MAELWGMDFSRVTRDVIGRELTVRGVILFQKVARFQQASPNSAIDSGPTPVLSRGRFL